MKKNLRMSIPLILTILAMISCRGTVEDITAWEFRGVVIDFEGPWYSGSSSSKYDLLELKYRKHFLEIVMTEMERYPEDFFERINLGKIAVVRNLSLPGNSQDARMMVGGFATGYMFFINAGCNYCDDPDDDHNNDFTKYSFHHELTHHVEFNFWARNNRHLLEPWNALWDASDRTGQFDSSTRGFITDYARTNQLEDRAEIMGYFMGAETENELFYEKARNDEIFYQKAIVLFTLLKETFGLDFLDEFLLKINQ